MAIFTDAVWNFICWIVLIVTTLVAVAALADLAGLFHFEVPTGQTDTNRTLTQIELVLVLAIAALVMFATVWTMYKLNYRLS